MVRQASLAAVVAAIAVLGLGQALGGRYWTPGLGLDDGVSAPTTGQAVIDDFQCRFAETRTVQMRGREDGFSSAGHEPSNPPAWMVDPSDPVTHLARHDYDVSQANGFVVDRFELDPGTVSGLFITSLRSMPDDQSETLFIGDLEDFRRPGDFQTVPKFYRNLNDLAQMPGWSRRGSLVWSPLEAIRMVLPNPESQTDLLHVVQASPQRVTLDVKVSDDTTVDFMALVTCNRPARHRGYTMRVGGGRDLAARSVVSLTVLPDQGTNKSGDPFTGDTECDNALPLMCFRDDRRPAPTGLTGVDFGADRLPALQAQWSGGSLRATEPVRGRDFARIEDADRLCSNRFGTGWRVADHHLGGHGFAIFGHGVAPPDGTRVWIDIKDQPYATCWARGPAAR